MAEEQTNTTSTTGGQPSTDSTPSAISNVSASTGAASTDILNTGPAFYTNLAMANAVAQQQGMYQIQAAIIGKIAESIITAKPAETGVDVNALAELLKAMQATPNFTQPK